MFQNKKTLSILKIVLIIWFVFTTLYFIKGEYDRLNQYVYKTGVNAGFEQAVVELIQKSQACQPVPLFANNQSEQLINLKCLQNTETPPIETPDDEASSDGQAS